MINWIGIKEAGYMHTVAGLRFIKVVFLKIYPTPTFRFTVVLSVQFQNRDMWNRP